MDGERFVDQIFKKKTKLVDVSDDSFFYRLRQKFDPACFPFACFPEIFHGIFAQVGYANQLRLAGMEKQEALVETGRTRMRPILMTMLTTVLAMCTMVFSTDAAAEMSRGMAIVVIGGLLYATLMTLFVVPVLYDILFRREVKKVEIGDEELLDEK